MYNGQVRRGFVFLIGTMLGLCVLVVPGIIIWAIGAYDACRSAKKINAGLIACTPAKSLHYILLILGQFLVIFAALIGIAFIMILNNGAAFMCTAPGECCGGTCLDTCNDASRFYHDYSYYLKGQKGQVTMALYPGMYNYSTCQAKGFRGSSEVKTKRYTEDQYQKRYISGLVQSIRDKSDDPDEQARIAISLVQNIPYDDGGAEENIKANYTLYTKYPYEVLAKQHGLCEEKSILLALLLKELGFGVAVFNFDTEHHSAVGIKTQDVYSYKNTGYAFVETTNPSIITDSYGKYGNNQYLNSTPDVFVVSEGLALGNLHSEWYDAKELDRLRRLSESRGNTLLSADYNAYQLLLKRYGIREVPSCGVCTKYCGQYNMYGECERAIRYECKPDCVSSTYVSASYLDTISQFNSALPSSLFSQGSSSPVSTWTVPPTSAFVYATPYPSLDFSEITGLRSVTPSPTSIFSAIQTSGKVAAPATPAYRYTPPSYQYTPPVYQVQPSMAMSSGPYTIWSPDGDSMTCSGGYCMTN